MAAVAQFNPTALEFLDASTVQVVKQIKKLLDPNGIMNPKKIFD
jgi:FAD/FMN-containing dehydrogenase